MHERTDLLVVGSRRDQKDENEGTGPKRLATIAPSE